ncbi:MAG TPA: VWA domain-containing protein, partial [Candidatus Nanoarchaeia archaeon]|nr:VWA domain-containing protein [Candidatus Nanoarchaeia archaeon]
GGMVFDPEEEVTVDQFSHAEAVHGSLDFQLLEPKLMHSIIENDEQAVGEAQIITALLNHNIQSFTPDLIMQQYTRDYRSAERLYGQRFLVQLSGYEEQYVQRNIHIPEFQRELKKKLQEQLTNLKKDKLVSGSGEITEKGLELAALLLYTEELEKLMPKGLRGERMHRKAALYGSKETLKAFTRGDRYRDLALKHSMKIAVRRGHATLEPEDLRSFRRESKGHCDLIYALDASGSMRGKKIELCKKAGIALAYAALRQKDRVGLLVFGKEIKEAIPPTQRFGQLLKAIANIHASAETDFAATIKKAIELFPRGEGTKHLLLITDALPTAGENPEADALKQTAIAAQAGITISLIGINLDFRGKKFGEKLVELGRGRFSIVKNLEQLDAVVLEDYYAQR